MIWVPTQDLDTGHPACAPPAVPRASQGRAPSPNRTRFSAPPVCSFFRHFKVIPRQQLLKETRFTLTQPSSEGHASRRAGPANSAPEFPCTRASQQGLPLPPPPKVHSQATLPETSPEGRRRHRGGQATPPAPVLWDQEVAQNCREGERPSWEGLPGRPLAGSPAGEQGRTERTAPSICTPCGLGRTRSNRSEACSPFTTPASGNH